jgi:hypothetical protein
MLPPPHARAQLQTVEAAQAADALLVRRPALPPHQHHDGCETEPWPRVRQCPNARPERSLVVSCGAGSSLPPRCAYFVFSDVERRFADAELPADVGRGRPLSTSRRAKAILVFANVDFLMVLALFRKDRPKPLSCSRSFDRRRFSGDVTDTFGDDRVPNLCVDLGVRLRRPTTVVHLSLRRL